MNKPRKYIDIVIPFHNEYSNLQILLPKLYKVIKKIKQIKFRIIFVNDGSSDNGQILIKKFIKENKNSYLLNNKKTLDFLNKVDELDCKTKSISNVAKDSRLRSSIVQKQYSEYNKFKKNIRSWSTDNIYESSLSRRLAI